MPRRDVVEGIDFSLPPAEAQRLRLAIERLQAQLKPSFAMLSEKAGVFKLNNVVGTIDLGSGYLLQVSPKVPADFNWTTAIVALLTGEERLDIAGERRAGVSQVHNKLLEAIAGVYLSRLETAFRQDGPIVLMERTSKNLPYLHGKLNVTKWARSALWHPHVFPVTRTELALDNPFTRCLAHVAYALAKVATNQGTRNGLFTLARDLSVGGQDFGQVARISTSRPLPEQWGAYKPAWSLALSILSKTSLFGATGNLTGVGLAIEAWPLLETLLERTLQSVMQVGRHSGRRFSYQMQGSVPLLIHNGGTKYRGFSPEPDGRLFEGGKLVAAFEAKYADFDGQVPPRDHIYQALSTAAACGAPLAVLVYPNAFTPVAWNVSGFQSVPSRLIAIGLDLFKWLPPAQADSRARMVLDAIDAENSELPSSNLQVAV